MTLVRIVKPWTDPDLFRQTPGGAGGWQDIRFTLDPVVRCDYLIALNHLPAPITVEVPPSNIWCLVQEPPVPSYRWLRRGFDAFARVYTPDVRLRGPRYVHAQGCLPWHVGRTYDELKQSPLPRKERDLSWITSNAQNKPGHRLRLQFLQRLRQSTPFDLFGRGFRPIADKWEGLAPYRYAIAFENHSCPHYFTEKLLDCYLANALPLYYGAPNIADYFPPESFVWIDPRDPDTPARINRILASDQAERSQAALAEARRRILDEYQFFPRVAALIQAHAQAGGAGVPRTVSLPANPNLTQYYLQNGPVRRLWLGLNRRLRRLLAAR